MEVDRNRVEHVVKPINHSNNNYIELYHCKRCWYTCPMSVLYKQSKECECNTCRLIQRISIKTWPLSNNHKRECTSSKGTETTFEDFHDAIQTKTFGYPKVENKILTPNLAPLQQEVIVANCAKEDLTSSPSDGYKHIIKSDGSKLTPFTNSPMSLSLMSMESALSTEDIDKILIRHLSVDSGYCGHEEKLKEKRAVQGDDFSSVL